MSLAQAIDDAAATVQLPAPLSQDEAHASEAVGLSLEQRIEAQSHYIRGREAGLEARHFLAIQEFEQALAIDPNNPAILRQLARSYAMAGNPARANSLYELILALAPGDSEAAFTLGSGGVRQGQFAYAAVLLGNTRRRERGFDHDPAANLLADRFLAIAFHQLGYITAELQALRSALTGIDAAAGPTAYADEVSWMQVRRGEFLRSIGDAHCRLGEFEQGLAAYMEARGSEGVDHPSLLPRLIYASLCTGRPASAQVMFLDSLSTPGAVFDERAIDLAAFLRAHGSVSDDLVLALQPLMATHGDPIAAARLAAALLPPERSAAELRRLVSRNPESLETIAQLFRALVSEDQGTVAALAIGLAEDHPNLAIDHARLLFAEFGLSPDLVESLRSDGGAAARLIEARLFLLAGAPTQAWHASAAGLQKDSALAPLHVTHIEACGDLGEAVLLDQAILAAPRDDPAILLAIAEAELSVGRRERALAAAERAVELSPDIAASHALTARLLAQDPATAQAAEAAAERALAIEPGLDSAYETLLAMHRPDGAIPSQSRLQEVVNRLRAESAQGRLFLLLAADERLGQRRFSQALEILVALHDRAPEDGDVLRRLTLAWLQSDQADTARRWLQDRIAQRPHDPNLLQQLVRVHLSGQEFIEAENILRDRIDVWPEDPLARSMLEVVLQAQGRRHEAWALAEERLLDRPPGHRREIERASLRLAMGEVDQAIELLAPLLDSITELTRNDAMRLLATATSWEAAPTEAAGEFQERALTVVLEQFPDAPLSAYAAAISRALAHGGAAGEIESLMARAIERADAGPAAQEAQQYRIIAQQWIGAGHTGAAADLLTRRLAHARRLDAQGEALLAQAAQAALIKIGRAEELLRLVDRLDADGVLASIFARSDKPKREALYAGSILATLIGQNDLADHLLIEAMRIDPAHAMTLNNLGYHRIEHGGSDAETADMIERAHDLLPDDPSILDTLAWLRYRQGDFGGAAAGAAGQGALNYLDRSIERTVEAGGEASAEVLEHRGDVLWRLGRHDEAVQSWRDAVEAADDDSLRELTLRNFESFQMNTWGLVVADPAEMFDNAYGPIVKRAREKLRAAEAGQEPAIAPTFAELQGRE